MAVDLSSTLARIEVELARLGLAHRQQAWQGDYPTGLRRWQIADRARLRALVADAVMATDGPAEMASLAAEAQGHPSPLSYYLGAMSPGAVDKLLDALMNTEF